MPGPRKMWTANRETAMSAITSKNVWLILLNLESLSKTANTIVMISVAMSTVVLGGMFGVPMLVRIVAPTMKIRIGTIRSTDREDPTLSNGYQFSNPILGLNR